MTSAFHHQPTAAKPASAPAQTRRRFNAIYAVITATALASAAAMACAQTTTNGAAETSVGTGAANQKGIMKIRINVEGQSATATLADTAASRDFVSMLPLILTLKDYSGTEKISDLPRKLSTQGAPAGYTPRAGDISYYAPRGNLAIFYRDFRHSEGLVKLGTVYAGMQVLDRPEPFTATVELIEPR